MKTPRHHLLFAASLTACTATAALAQPAHPGNGPWDTIGSVSFAPRATHDVQFGSFGGSVERLSFRPNNDVYCRNVSATFANGRTRSIFHGTLHRDRSMVVDLPGDDRMIRRIDFTCAAQARHDARVTIAADIGHYRPEWRQSRDWTSHWSRLFSWARDDHDQNHWVRFGSERFQGPRDRETSFTTRPDIDSIALMPVDANAQCSRITATYRDGHRSQINVNTGNRMSENRLYRVNLPQTRNLAKLDLTCHAERAQAVTIQVYGMG